MCLHELSEQPFTEFFILSSSRTELTQTNLLVGATLGTLSLSEDGFVSSEDRDAKIFPRNDLEESLINMVTKNTIES